MFRQQNSLDGSDDFGVELGSWNDKMLEEIMDAILKEASQTDQKSIRELFNYHKDTLAQRGRPTVNATAVLRRDSSGHDFRGPR